jgi:hypothetical protein
MSPPASVAQPAGGACGTTNDDCTCDITYGVTYGACGATYGSCGVTQVLVVPTVQPLITPAAQLTTAPATSQSRDAKPPLFPLE